MRKLDKIIVHCADTPEHMDIGVNEIRQWHVKDNGWSDIGYHYVIRRNGTVETGRPLNKAGAHCYGHNATSIGICLIGRNEFNHEQFQALNKLVKDLQKEFKIESVKGHRDYDSGKTCPNFNVEEELMKFNKEALKESAKNAVGKVLAVKTKSKLIAIAITVVLSGFGITVAPELVEPIIAAVSVAV